MSKKVLIARVIPSVAEDLLKQAGFTVSVWKGNQVMTKDELIEHARKVDALLSLGSNKLDRSFFETCKHLEIVSQFAVGFDNIDVAAATEFKIPVCNTPDVLSEATADVAFGLMINVSRKMFYNHKLILRGEWKQFEPLKNLGFELTGKTLGIFGLGRIGSIMAQRCKGAYGMNVIYHNRNRNLEAEKETNARYVDFDTLLRESDILSIHSALTPETAGLFNKHVFSKMKRTAVFINTARGGVHNETDLIEALQNGTIWGAGLDVTNPEPMQANNPLLQMPNVAVLPHIGSATLEARTGMARLAAENIISYYKTGKPVTLVNPKALF
ncbi:MAG TPA: D-glycerate dehydrogenase [Cyclobacteriaceae bacterium]|nr:D-glycerate dehydrogenase [Cyclobacteriaceae bacterium]